MWGDNAQANDNSDSEESSEEESGSDDEAGPSNSSAAQQLSREDRKKDKQARKAAAVARAKAAAVQVGDLPPSDSEEDEDDNMPANPNHSKAARKQATIPKKADSDEDEEVEQAAKGVAKMSVKPQSRKERESAEAAAAKERYMKLHLAGKTDQAKADMARLAEIRAKREADKARREVSVFQPWISQRLCVDLEQVLTTCVSIGRGRGAQGTGSHQARRNREERSKEA